MSNSQTPAAQSARSQIAMWVIIGSTAILIVLGLTLVFSAAAANRAEAAEKLFTMVIPMLGTWVGTVLAYYFSGENFEKASQSVSQLVDQVKDQRLRLVKVKDVMLSRGLMEVVTLSSSNDGSTINLKDNLIDKLKDPVTRIPVLSDAGLAKYIIHQSLIYKFVTQNTIKASEANQTFPVADQTLKNFLDFGDMKQEVESTFAFVGQEASLADAKNAMENLTGCQDVFVTEDGTSGTQVKGWLTNVQIAKHAKA